MAKEISIVLNRNSSSVSNPTIPTPMPPVGKMIGFWGTVTEVHPENCTCRVRMASGYVIANVRVLVQSWVTVDDKKGYLSGERYLPPVDTFVLCVCPEGNLADTVIIGSGFALSAAVHAAFKTDSDDTKELDNAANTRKIVRNSGWTSETDYRNGTKKIRNTPEEADATISIEVNQGEDGEKADGGVTTVKVYGTTITATEKDDEEVKVETVGNTIIDITKDKIDFSTDTKISRSSKKAFALTTEDSMTLSAQKDIGLKSSGSGTLELGNTVATLGAMISDLFDALSDSAPVTYGSPASHMWLPSFVAKIKAIKAKWGQVFK